MTLEELQEIKSALEYGRNVDSYLNECDKAIEIIQKQIDLKLLDPRYAKETEDTNRNNVQS